MIDDSSRICRCHACFQCCCSTSSTTAIIYVRENGYFDPLYWCKHLMLCWSGHLLYPSCCIAIGHPFSFVVLSSILVAWHRRLKVQVKTIAAYIPLQPPCTLLIVMLIVSFIFSIALLHIGAHTYVSLKVLFYIYALA